MSSRWRKASVRSEAKGRNAAGVRIVEETGAGIVVETGVRQSVRRFCIEEGAVVSDEVAAAAEGLIAGTVEGPADAAALSTSSGNGLSGNGAGSETRQSETRAPRNPGGGDRGPGRGGDRGGRGRRGRRRRGGRGSGLPESKFFSPGSEAAKGAAAGTDSDNEVDTESDNRIEPENEKETKETAAPVISAPVAHKVPSEDFMVLPGESLAKYSPADERDEPVEIEEEDFTNVAEPQDTAPEEEVEQANRRDARGRCAGRVRRS